MYLKLGCREVPVISNDRRKDPASTAHAGLQAQRSHAATLGTLVAMPPTPLSHAGCVHLCVCVLYTHACI